MYDIYIYIYVYMIDNSRTNIPIIVISRKHRNVTQPVFFTAVGMVVKGRVAVFVLVGIWDGSRYQICHVWMHIM